MASGNPKIIFLAREQVFRFTLSGLMPSTVHQFYFERQRVASSKLKPSGGKLGDALKTDIDGKITFDYFYDSGISPESSVEKAQQQAALVAGNKEVVLTNINTSSLSEGFQTTSLSYFRGHIRINVYIPQESEYTRIAVAATPPATYWDDGGYSAGSTG